jgi:hypothetical protein
VTPPPEAAWAGLVDDAAIFPPGDAPLSEAAAAHTARRGEPWAGLVGTFVLRDTDLPQVRDRDAALSVVLTGGAGQVAGPAALCRRLGLRLAGLEIALRDLDDPAGNARRVVAAVDAARAEGTLDEDVPVHVELPVAEPSYAWLAAADEVAAAELRLKFRTGGLEADAFPRAATLAAWVDAALDRETAFKCTAGLHHAVRRTSPEGFEQHGFLNVLLATRRAFDGAGRDDVVATLEERDAATLVAAAGAADLAGARRWFTSFGSCSVAEPLDDLITLGLAPQSWEKR